MPEPDFHLKLGDTASSIFSTLLDSAGDAVDIQGASIRWKMMPLAGGTVTINDAATNSQVGTGGTSNTTTGDVLYGWGTHPGTVGLYLGEWEVTYASGSVQSFPNDGFVLVNVMGDVR